ncbi:hypothetical protein F0562_020999 [Nyssa sinensis]|uniref:RIN4 pathogenic type III effector avirulence factor Avr cleavage site domain-containing protein n=1 Tax=Nyssa sinensis TaxID=561372 RepID=A0A5J5BLH5_9ASTE|nr:hypothetical protein F0562_020999 [Nyssa sinensis]
MRYPVTTAIRRGLQPMPALRMCKLAIWECLYHLHRSMLTHLMMMLLYPPAGLLKKLETILEGIVDGLLWLMWIQNGHLGRVLTIATTCSRVSSNQMIIDCDLYIDLEGSSNSSKDNVQSVASTPPPPTPTKGANLQLPSLHGSISGGDVNESVVTFSQHPHVTKFGNWESGENVPYTVYFDKAQKDRNGGKMINPNDPQENPDMFPNIESPAQAQAPCLQNLDLTRGTNRTRSITRGDESPVIVAAVPKFGEWDENNPASADGYTHIFNQVRVERHAGECIGS